MTERTTIEERYLKATEASSLLLKENSVGPVDILMAAGLASQGGGIYALALGLWRMKEGDMSKANASCDALVEWLERGQPTRNAYASRIRARNRAVVARTLGWWAKPTCDPCHGRGHPLILDTPVVDYTRSCTHCHGSGWTPLERAVQSDDIPTARMIVARIERITDDVFHDMKRLLNSR